MFPLNYSDVQNISEDFQKIKNKYNIIACVGNIQPNIDIPYFSIEELFNKGSREKFSKFLESEGLNAEEDIYKVAKKIY